MASNAFPWRTAMLYGYYSASLPLRFCVNRTRRLLGRAPIMGLFLHRVADDKANDWTMSRSEFTHLIDWLEPRFDIVSFAEAQRRIQANRNPRPAVFLTFDDGYAENSEFALPLLRQRGLACTYFVTVSNLISGEPFSHDLKIGKPCQPNTIQQLKELQGSKIDVGCHAYDHVSIGKLSGRAALTNQIVDSRNKLQDLIGQPVAYFAFPFGQHEDLSAQAFEIARNAGYAGACSAYGGYNFPGDDAFHLQRIHADADLLPIKNWLTVDPRKFGITRRFEDTASCEAHLVESEFSSQEPQFTGNLAK